MDEQLPQNPLNADRPSRPGTVATIALLKQWELEDATDDPCVVAQAERDYFKTALNANRPPDRPLFP